MGSLKIRQKKLAQLSTLVGMESVHDLLKDAALNDVVPAICVGKECSYACEVAAEQREAFCPKCKKNSIASALILADLI